MKAHLTKITLLLILFASCTTPELDLPELETILENRLVNSNEYYNFSSQILRTIAQRNSNESLPYSFRDVAAVKIVYNTTNYDGEEIISSGVLLLPQISGSLPLLTFQHGELFGQENAPSRSITGANDLTQAAIIASTGIAVLVTDYIGYGNSSLHWHPFEHKASLAQSCFDMLLASKEYLKEKRIKTTSKLFLAGYSEGGIATLGLQQLLEEKTTFKINKTIMGNGTYSKLEWAKEILQNHHDSKQLRYFIRMLHSYNRIYPELNRPWDFYLNKTYTGLMPVIDQLMDLPNEEMNPTVLFTPEFIAGIVNETDTAFVSVLKDNQSPDWKWQAPIYFYRGSEDSLLSPINTLLASQMIENAGGQVDTTILIGEDHESVVLPFTLNILKEIHFNLH